MVKTGVTVNGWAFVLSFKMEFDPWWDDALGEVVERERWTATIWSKKPHPWGIWPKTEAMFASTKEQAYENALDLLDNWMTAYTAYAQTPHYCAWSREQDATL